jgi:transcriptional regulator with XRE-family HTH domain
MTEQPATMPGKTYAEVARTFLSEGNERASVFLEQQWLSGATALLRQCRREAGLTQAEVAERMGTTRAVVARLERDTRGHFTLRRFVDYLMACGVQPFQIEVAPTEDLVAFLRDDPEVDRTAVALAEWKESGTGNGWGRDRVALVEDPPYRDLSLRGG